MPVCREADSQCEALRFGPFPENRLDDCLELDSRLRCTRCILRALHWSDICLADRAIAECEGGRSQVTILKIASPARRCSSKKYYVSIPRYTFALKACRMRWKLLP